jgi:hypothetical protein
VNTFLLVISFVSVAISAASLLFTAAAYHRLNDQGHEVFKEVGAVTGNHEARLEHLEDAAHIKSIPSPSQAIAISDVAGSGFVDFADAFDTEHENTDLQHVPDVAHSSNEDFENLI